LRKQFEDWDGLYPMHIKRESAQSLSMFQPSPTISHCIFFWPAIGSFVY